MCDEFAKIMHGEFEMSMMGELNFFMFSVCLCALFQEAPKTSHLEAVKRIFRYIKGTTHLGLWYPNGTDIETVVYADSDHAGTSGILYIRGMLFDILVLEETNRSCYIHYRIRIRKRWKGMSTSTMDETSSHRLRCTTRRRSHHVRQQRLD
ncbi:hypothetical protein Tco_0101970 [Tanacetum coccineum]